MSGHGSPALLGSIAENPSHKIFAFLSKCEDGHIAPARSVLAIQPREERGCNAPKAVHCPHRDRGPPRCWGQGSRAQARLAQGLFHLCRETAVPSGMKSLPNELLPE